MDKPEKSLSGEKNFNGQSRKKFNKTKNFNLPKKNKINAYSLGPKVYAKNI